MPEADIYDLVIIGAGIEALSIALRLPKQLQDVRKVVQALQR